MIVCSIQKSVSYQTWQFSLSLAVCRRKASTTKTTHVLWTRIEVLVKMPLKLKGLSKIGPWWTESTQSKMVLSDFLPEKLAEQSRKKFLGPAIFNNILVRKKKSFVLPNFSGPKLPYYFWTILLINEFETSLSVLVVILTWNNGMTGDRFSEQKSFARPNFLFSQFFLPILFPDQFDK